MDVNEPSFNYTGMERDAREFLMSDVGGYSLEEVARMTRGDVVAAIVKWCERNEYHVIQEDECVTLAPNNAKFFYLER